MRSQLSFEGAGDKHLLAAFFSTFCKQTSELGGRLIPVLVGSNGVRQCGGMAGYLRDTGLALRVWKSTLLRFEERSGWVNWVDVNDAE